MSLDLAHDKPTLVQVTAWCLPSGTKPFPESMLTQFHAAMTSPGYNELIFSPKWYGMGWLLWVQRRIYILYYSLSHHMQYCVTINRIIKSVWLYYSYPCYAHTHANMYPFAPKANRPLKHPNFVCICKLFICETNSPTGPSACSSSKIRFMTNLNCDVCVDHQSKNSWEFIAHYFAQRIILILMSYNPLWNEKLLKKSFTG